MNDLPIRLVLCDIRSTYNVGSIMRTADAIGIDTIYACGTTPFPHITPDQRPAHVAASNHRAIAKTALGAEQTVRVLHYPDAAAAVEACQQDGYALTVLEQAENSLSIFDFKPAGRIALIVGNEINGVPQGLLEIANVILEIPMQGQKESLNVAVATGVALYQLRYGPST